MMDYDLNVVKEIAITESFKSLDEKVRHCETLETQDDCITKFYLNKLKAKCKCVPFQLSHTEEVSLKCRQKRSCNTTLPSHLFPCKLSPIWLALGNPKFHPSLSSCYNVSLS